MIPMILKTLVTSTNQNAFDERTHDCYYHPPMVLVSLRLLVTESLPTFSRGAPALEETKNHRGAGEPHSRPGFLLCPMSPDHFFDIYQLQIWTFHQPFSIAWFSGA
jgi:hypothetical protein